MKQLTNYISYARWLNYSFQKVSRKHFPDLIKDQTDMELPSNWKDPPIVSVPREYLKGALELGFQPSSLVENSYVFTGIALPLVIDRLHIGAFMVAYRRRRGLSSYRWVKYTSPKLVGANTPLLCVSGAFRSKPDAYLVDNLKDYLKLINWVYCQEKTYALGRHKAPPQIIYVNQGINSAVEKMRTMQMFFNKLTDFTGKFVEEIKQKMTMQRKGFRVNVLQYFSENPISHCYSRIQFEDAVNVFSQKFISP